MESGDKDEFEELVAPHLDALFGYALRMTQSRPDADDLLQESLFRAFRGLSGFKRGTNFRAWVFRIVTNAWISRKRRDARAPALLDVDGVQDAEAVVHEELDDAETDWERVYQESFDDDVKRALDDLPAEFRAPLLLVSLGEPQDSEVVARDLANAP